jgi:hypothetical protein
VLFVKERNEADCHFVVFAPDWWKREPKEWTLRAWVKGQWVREEKVPMVYPTQLGIDISDWDEMEKALESMVRDVLAGLPTRG